MPPACTFLVPGDWHSRTGGYLYDRQVVDQLRAAGWKVAVASPGDGFPWPDAAAQQCARQVVEALPDGALVVADGLGFGVLPELVEAHAARLRWVALVHHPLALESGLAEPQRAQLFDSERRALAHARHVIVTSPSTAHALAPYDVAPARISVVEPGTDPAPLAEGGGAGPGALSLLCVATVVPRKGHVLLLEALAGLRDRRWHLHCAGSLARDADEGRRALAATERLGLGDRVTWHGEVDAGPLAALYAQADLFVLPSWYEGYGMALAEALARGLPIVSSAAGAIVDTVPADAGLLVPPGEVGALREALRRTLDEPATRSALAAGARAAAARLPRWFAAGQRFAAALQSVGPRPP